MNDKKIEETSHKLPALDSLPQAGREIYRHAWIKETEKTNQQISTVLAKTEQAVAEALATQHVGDPSYVGSFLQQMQQNVYSALQTFMVLQSAMPDEVQETFLVDFVKCVNIATESAIALRKAYAEAADKSHLQ